MIAKQENENLKEKYTYFDYLNLIAVAIFYVSTAILIVPFVRLYTNEVTDADYIRPYFALLIIFAEALYNIQFSYCMLVAAAGHFRQTKKDSYLEALINIVVSLLLVKRFGLSGVAVGTICGISWRLITYVIYLSKNIICWKPTDLIKRYFVTFLGAIASYIVITKFLVLPTPGYFEWVIYAMYTTIISSLIILFISSILNGKEMKKVYEIYFKRFY